MQKEWREMVLMSEASAEISPRFERGEELRRPRLIKMFGVSPVVIGEQETLGRFPGVTEKLEFWSVQKKIRLSRQLGRCNFLLKKCERVSKEAEQNVTLTPRKDICKRTMVYNIQKVYFH